MFYTRPNLPNLGIDLVKLEGGGSCPSQFFGETKDGRQIYIRYRGGAFSVRLSEKGQPGHKGEQLIDEVIGPWLHGDMLLEQACDLAGITVRGSKPALTVERWREESEKAFYLDFSGCSTYWIKELLINRQGGEKLIALLRQRFPNSLLAQFCWTPGLVRRFSLREDMSGKIESLLIGLNPNQGLVNELCKREYVRILDAHAAFSHVIELNFTHNQEFADTKRMSEAQYVEIEGRKIAVHARLPGTITIRTLAGDPVGDAVTAGVIEDVRSCCGTMSETVDFANGEVSAPFENFAWFGNDLAEWCRGASDRFLGISYKNHDMKRPLGVRPAKSL